MKVCLLASTYPRFPGDGAGRFMHSIAEALVRQGHDVHAVIPYHPAIRPQPGAVQIHPFRYIWPDRWAIMGYAQAMHSDRALNKGAYLLAPLFFASAFSKLLRLHAVHHFDIIHAHWVIPNAPMAALFSRLKNVPLIITLHGSDIFVARKNALLGAIAGACFKQANAVTACSPQLYEGALTLGASPQRTHLLLWGADPERFDPQRAPSQVSLREKLGLPSHAPIVLSLGRLVKKKGVEYLVQAIPYVREHIPDVLVVIAGDGPERSHLTQLALHLGVQAHVRFVGAVPWHEVPEYLHTCDVFVVPSVVDESGNLDGLPTTILEAMAAAKPVVATDVAGIPLVVEHEKTGLLVPQRDPQALATALVDLLRHVDKRHRLGIAARQRVEAELNWDNVARFFTELYNEAVRGQSHAHV